MVGAEWNTDSSHRVCAGNSVSFLKHSAAALDDTRFPQPWWCCYARACIRMRASTCVHAMCYGRRQLCLSRHTQFNCVCHDTLVTTHTPVLSRLLQHARERERDGLGRRRWHSGLACRISLSFERCRSCIEKSPQKNTRKPRPTEAYTNTRITNRFQ